MADRPILFSEPMIHALHAGRKTQTRRAIKPRGKRPSLFDGSWADSYVLDPGNASWRERDVPMKAGDRLWVREAWSGLHAFRNTPPAQRESISTPDGPLLRDDICYWADGNLGCVDYERPRSSLHMPRWASRMTLMVTDVRVQRLQDITEEDAVAEGCFKGNASGRVFANEASMHLGGDEWANARDWYADLWDSINGAGAWDANPWVAAYTFTVHHQNIDQLGRVAA